jgi:DNA-binding transcriptional MerR regulator
MPVPVRDANGYRRYGVAAVDRVRLIQRVLDVGFTLDEPRAC